MSPSPKKPKPAPRKAKPKPKAKQKPKPKPKPLSGSFTGEFAALLRSRRIPVPRGLQTAPPEAYANAPASFVEELARLPDADLERYADRVAGFATRQAARARAAWDSSPLIAELRRRKLSEPTRPSRVVGASVSLAKRLAEWSDAELLAAAREWSKRAAR
jgi:hypothetical protein